MSTSTHSTGSSYKNSHVKYCKNKKCKWCLVYKNAPDYIGANCLISNEVETKNINCKKLESLTIKTDNIQSQNIKTQNIKTDIGSFNKLRIAGIEYTSLERETYRLNLIPNLNFDKVLRTINLKSEADIDLDKVYYGSQDVIQGFLVQYFDITKDSDNISEVIFNPSFSNNGDINVQISTTIIVAKFREQYDGKFGCDYEILQKVYSYIPPDIKLTINNIWKGPLSKKYKTCFSNQKIYLLFLIETSNNIIYIPTKNQDISIII